MGQSIDSRVDDLTEAWEMVANLLVRAGVDRKSQMHTPVISTVGEGGFPEARTVVLRQFDLTARTLRFHTDARSPKIAQMEADSRVSALFYDRDAKVQIRARGKAIIHGEDEVARIAWDSSKAFARRCYLEDPGPSSLSEAATSGLTEELEGREPTPEELDIAFPLFRVVLIHVESLDWLYLSHLGHRRALFTWRGDGEREATWLVP